MQCMGMKERQAIVNIITKSFEMPPIPVNIAIFVLHKSYSLLSPSVTFVHAAWLALAYGGF